MGIYIFGRVERARNHNFGIVGLDWRDGLLFEPSFFHVEDVQHAWNLNVGHLKLEIVNVLKMCSTHGTFIFEIFEEVQHGRNQILQHCVVEIASTIKMFELFENGSLDFQLD